VSLLVSLLLLASSFASLLFLLLPLRFFFFMFHLHPVGFLDTLGGTEAEAPQPLSASLPLILRQLPQPFF
jgi:hypothetical protein